VDIRVIPDRGQHCHYCHKVYDQGRWQIVK
jgi:hypothetical protein